jgi:hypothetical protein
VGCEILSIFRTECHSWFGSVSTGNLDHHKKPASEVRYICVYLIKFQTVKSAHPHYTEQCSVSHSGLHTAGTSTGQKTGVVNIYPANVENRVSS